MESTTTSLNLLPKPDMAGSQNPPATYSKKTGKGSSGHRISQHQEAEKLIPAGSMTIAKGELTKLVSTFTAATAKPVTTHYTAGTKDSTESTSGISKQSVSFLQPDAITSQQQPVLQEPATDIITNQPTGQNDKPEEVEFQVFESSQTETPPSSTCDPMQWIQRIPCFRRDTGDTTCETLYETLTEYLSLQNEPESEKQDKKHAILKMTLQTTTMNYQNPMGNTPLMLAVKSQDLEIISAILAQKPKLELANRLGRTALHEAAACGNTEIPALLLSAEHTHFQCSYNPFQTNPVEQLDSYGFSPLLISLIQNKRDMTSALISLGANPEKPDQNGRTALHNAAIYGAEDCIDVLLQDARTVITKTDNNKRTALHYACLYNHSGIAEKIIIADQSAPETYLNLQDKYGYSPLSMAVVGQNIECMEKMINQGARTNIKDYEGRTLIAIASSVSKGKESGNNTALQMIEKLIESGVKPDPLMNDGKSCLHLAAQTDNVELCKMLINYGLDPALQDKDMRLPLHDACIYDAQNTVIHLLTGYNEHGANTTASDGILPLHFACALESNLHQENKQADVTSLTTLLEKTDNPNSLDTYGWSPLTVSCIYGREENVRQLLTDPRVDPNFSAPDGFPPLFHSINAIRKGKGSIAVHMRIVELLIKHNANPYHSAHDNNTPLQLAATTDEELAIRMIQLAPPTKEYLLMQRTDYGLTVAQLASRSGFHKLYKCLKEYTD